MLDTVAEAWAAANDGEDIWANPDVTFLDPFTKSGVFLREITARLTDGLAEAIPDLEERVDHILTRQVYGIAITSLTSLLARRSVYCSKDATGKHSIVQSFDDKAGNIWFERIEHTWVKGKCGFCGASKTALERGAELETHAYAFIHTDDINARIAELFGEDMQFDVDHRQPAIPAQRRGRTERRPCRFTSYSSNVPRTSTLGTCRWSFHPGGSPVERGWTTSASRCSPTTACVRIDDYLSCYRTCSPGVGLKGGVCYFLWDRDNPRTGSDHDAFKDWPTSTATRPLLEAGADVFIRFNEGLPILKKVVAVETGQSDYCPYLKTSVLTDSSARASRSDLTRHFKGKTSQRPGDLAVYQKGGKGYIARERAVDTGTATYRRVEGVRWLAAPGTGNRDTLPA